MILDIEKQNKGHFKNTKDFFTNREKDSLTDNDKITDVRYNKVTKQFKEILDYFVSESEGSILDAGLYRKNGKFVRMYTDVAPSYMADRIEEIKDDETLFEKAEAGDVKAQYSLANAYQYGYGGVKKNMKTAAEWYRRAAEGGHMESQCNYGLCFANGAGVKKDFSQAVVWFRKAALQDSP